MALLTSTSSSSSGSLTTSDWFTKSCSQLGGGTVTSGACYVRCEKQSTCTSINSSLSCHLSGGWVNKLCHVSSCTKDSDCGPSGWSCDPLYGCQLKCKTSTISPSYVYTQSSECPTGFACFVSSDKTRAFCVRELSSPPCGGACDAECCVNGSCCGGVFCGGDCVGNPCCK